MKMVLASNGKPDAGNPQVWFDESNVVSVATPRCVSLFYKKMQTLSAVVTVLVSLEMAAATSTSTSYTGEFYYANGWYYKTVYSGQGMNTIRTPSKPSPDSGTPLSEYGWIWLGWGREVMSGRGREYHSCVSAGSSITTGTFGDITHYFYSTYSRTNYYHYYNSESSTSVTTKKWEQQYSSASVSSVTLPALMTQSIYNWVPKGWTATDKSYSSESDILYSSIGAKIVYPPANTNQNLRAVYNRVKTILFNGNGATNGTVANKTFTQWFIAGKGATGAITLPENGFVRTAYTFNGWSTNSTATIGLADGTIVMPDGEWTSPDTQTYYAVWTPLVVPKPDASAIDGTVFCGDSYTIMLSCPLDGATIYYSTNGVTPRTSAAFAYTGPIVIYGNADIVAVAMKDGVKSEYTRVSITQIEPDAPVIAPVDGTEFRSDTCEVTISCPTDGAEIYYTLDGSTPNRDNGVKYTDPFTIDGTTTVKAVAVGGPFNSEVVTATFTKRTLSLAEAAGAVALPFVTDETAPWLPILDASAESGFAAQSGGIGFNSSTWMETTVNGAGTFAFKWRVECEEDDSGQATWDRLTVFTNGIEAARIDGVKAWTAVSFAFHDIGSHTIRWEFSKDDYDEPDADFADCGWVSGVVWSKDVVVDVGGGKTVTVPGAWLLKNTTRAATDVAANGRKVWECYVLGLNPDVAAEDFKITEFALNADGTLNLDSVKYAPEHDTWNVPGANAVLKGAATLDGEWQTMTEANKSSFRFFKVVVELP